MTSALYIHLPFCVRKCAYCDFESYAGRLALRDEYIDDIIKETQHKYALYGDFSVPTVYLGGGTPSLLEATQLERLLGGVFDVFPPDNGAEISMEMNPGTVTPEKLRAAHNMGVNRISFGVQAAQASILRSIGRIHTFADAEGSVRMARDAGFSNISCDIMFALPGQTADDMLETVQKTVSLGVKHISCYSLIPEAGTPLFERIESGEAVLPDEDASCAMQTAAVHALEALGYHRYEISNYARAGYECRHNIVYWMGGNYLGLGCAAHSFMNGERFSNPRMDEYMRGITHIDSEFIDAQGRLEEKLMLETRMTCGTNLLTYPADTRAKLIREAQKPMYRGLIDIDDNYLRFTEQGLMLHNALHVNLICAAAK